MGRLRPTVLAECTGQAGPYHIPIKVSAQLCSALTYKDSNSKQFHSITEHACKFLWRVMQHVLPKGFRRARDYGFLHGNAKATLKRLQLQLKVNLPPPQPVVKKTVCCDQCHQPMALYLMRIGNKIILDGTARLAKTR